MRRLPVILAVAAATVAIGSDPAGAHAFLAHTDPVQGARLGSAPDELVLRFSEPVAADSLDVALRAGGDAAVGLGPVAFDDGRRVARTAVPPLADAVYLLAFHAVSAVDGHETSGEVAFAVGDVTGALPAAREGGSSTDWAAVVGTWVFFAGTAAAGGGMLAQHMRLPGLGLVTRRHLGRVGLLVAFMGAAVRFAAEPAGGRDLAMLLVLAGLMLGILVLGLTSRPVPVLVVLLGSWAAWSSLGHASTDGALAVGLDFVHLAAGLLWAGALAQVVGTVRSARREGWRPTWEAVLRYGRLALFLVLVLATAGTISAVGLVPTLGDLWSTAYGNVVVAKVVLLAAAASLALAARVRGFDRGPARTGRLVAVESALLVAALVLAGVLAQMAPPRPALAAETLLGPPPITGPVAHAAGLVGAITVDVAVGDGRIDVRLLTPSGGIDGGEVDVSARFPDGTVSELRPRGCGDGCFTQALELPAGRTTLNVGAAAPGWDGGAREFTLDWPPPPEASERFDAMVAAMRSAPAVLVSEVVSSHGPPPVPTSEGVAMTGEEFVALMPWAGGGVVDVRTVRDRPSAFTFYLPGSRMYFEVEVDGAGRLVEQRAVNPGHEIATRFSYPSQ